MSLKIGTKSINDVYFLGVKTPRGLSLSQMKHIQEIFFGDKIVYSDRIGILRAGVGIGNSYLSTLVSYGYQFLDKESNVIDSYKAVSPKLNDYVEIKRNNNAYALQLGGYFGDTFYDVKTYILRDYTTDEPQFVHGVDFTIYTSSKYVAGYSGIVTMQNGYASETSGGRNNKAFLIPQDYTGVKVTDTSSAQEGSFHYGSWTYSRGTNPKDYVHMMQMPINRNPQIAMLTARVNITEGVGTGWMSFNDGAGGYSEGACLLPGTKVLMSDRTIKNIEDIKAGDSVIVFNHETGKLDVSNIVFNDYETDKVERTVFDVSFENGETISVCGEHGFFDLTLNKYIYINGTTYNDFYNHYFYTIDGKTRLKDVKLRTVKIELYSPVTYKHLNLFTNKLLSMPGGISGLFNIFEYNCNLKYDSTRMQKDIDKYGLYTLDDLKQYGVTKEMFEAYNGKYLKVSLGKKLITELDIYLLVARYKNFTN